MAEGFQRIPMGGGNAEVQRKEMVPLPLPYGPQTSGGNGGLPVIACGIFSTAVALLAVYLLQDQAHFNAMGEYLDYVFPIGAILVGLAASSGYALMAWILGVKIRRGLLVAIVILQVGGYFAAKYTEFYVKGPFFDRATHKVITFPEYFQITTVKMAWKGKDGKLGEPLGQMGYLLRLGELAGFIFGAIGSPLILRKKPYCELCQRYMKTKDLARLPATNTKANHLFGKAEINMTAEQVLAIGMRYADEFFALGCAGDTNNFTAKLREVAPQRKKAARLGRRIVVQMVSCSGCASGRLISRMVVQSGRRVTSKKMKEVEVSQEFVRGLRDQGVV